MTDETSSNESAVARSPARATTVLNLDALVAEHYQTLYRYAYRLAGSAADAEDLTQQVFMVAQQKLDQVRQPDKVRSWLFSVLRNSYLKNRHRPAAIPVANLEFDVDSIAQPMPAADDFDRQRLQQAIDDLPDALKLVLMMYYFEECSYKEISEKLHLPMGTVMSRLSRAKGHLRRRLLAPDKSGRQAAPVRLR